MVLLNKSLYIILFLLSFSIQFSLQEHLYPRNQNERLKEILEQSFAGSKIEPVVNKNLENEVSEGENKVENKKRFFNNFGDHRYSMNKESQMNNVEEFLKNTSALMFLVPDHRRIEQSEENTQKKRSQKGKSNNRKRVSTLTDFRKARVKRDINIKLRLYKQPVECLYAHNFIRKIYRAPELRWDKNLQYNAERYALKLALNDKGLVNSGYIDENGVRYGENLYIYRGGEPKNCRDALHLWYQGFKKHDFDNLKPLYNAFTQVVWDETRRLGVGVAYRNGKTYIVARYLPSMLNYGKDFKEHVGKPKGNPNILKLNLVPRKNPQPYIQTIDVNKKNEDMKDCKDFESACSYWEKEGYCQLSPKFMALKCPKSCKLCSGRPIDGAWTSWTPATPCAGLCGTGRREEHRFCINPSPINGGNQCPGDKRRFNVCQLNMCNPDEKCVDLESNCPGYFNLGYCLHHKYKKWMEINCKRTCQICKN